jgi:hypothetical protein
MCCVERLLLHVGQAGLPDLPYIYKCVIVRNPWLQVFFFRDIINNDQVQAELNGILENDCPREKGWIRNSTRVALSAYHPAEHRVNFPTISEFE